MDDAAPRECTSRNADKDPNDPQSSYKFDTGVCPNGCQALLLGLKETCKVNVAGQQPSAQERRPRAQRSASKRV